MDAQLEPNSRESFVACERAKFVTSRCDSPNAGHVFANLCRISTLKLAQLGVLFDLEENFLAR